jgi:hypothetical protein
MDAFRDACEIEAESLRQLVPWIESRAKDGHVVKTAKGRLSKELQKRYGDLFAERKNGEVVAIEIKAEEYQGWGNLYLETWSNLSRYTPGWMFTLDADVLLYHFLGGENGQELYSIAFHDLRRWAFKVMNRMGTQGRMWEYIGKEQKKRKQLNDTWGRCVPIDVLKAEAGLTDISHIINKFMDYEPPQQQTLFDGQDGP